MTFTHTAVNTVLRPAFLRLVQHVDTTTGETQAISLVAATPSWLFDAAGKKLGTLAKITF